VTRPALRIGSLELGTRPRIAVPFTGAGAPTQIPALARRGLDVAELRFDLFGTQNADAWLAAVAEFAPVPVLATIRCAAEGGSWKGSEPDRLERYRALLERVDAVDVEIASPIAREVVAAARARGKLAIASFHDFAATPALAALEDVVARGRAAGADAVKIATAVARPADLRTLARVLLGHDDVGLIVIGMGEGGAASRVLFPALGSLLTYASLDAKTAPGQLELDELVRLLDRLGV
jgi:3-dehydroquinate dehydratase-1